MAGGGVDGVLAEEGDPIGSALFPLLPESWTQLGLTQLDPPIPLPPGRRTQLPLLPHPRRVGPVGSGPSLSLRRADPIGSASSPYPREGGAN